MIDLLEIFSDITDWLRCWRFYVCLLIVVLGAIFLHGAYPDATWPYFVSVPTVILGIAGGLIWQRRSGSE